MKAAGVKTHKGKDSYGEGDEYHLELTDTKLKSSDKRVKACYPEYARLTRSEGKAQNDRFETKHAKHIEKAVAKS
jgi:hypothetical protein